MITLALLIAGISPNSQRSFLRGRDALGREYWVVQNTQNSRVFDVWLNETPEVLCRLQDMNYLGALRAGRSIRKGRRFLRGLGPSCQIWAMEAAVGWVLKMDPKADLSSASGLSLADAGARQARPAIEVRSLSLSLPIEGEAQ